MHPRFYVLLIGLSHLLPARAITAVSPASLRTTPAAGIRITDTDRARLESGAASLDRQLDELRAKSKSNPRISELLPDVEIFHKAVDWALRYDELFRSNEVALADNLLRLGTARAKQLTAGNPAWLTSTGLVVRGFRSKIDGSVQPYGLVVPASFATETIKPRRLDVWLHGRDDKLTELKFLSDRLRSYGEFTPPDTLVLHPYGRFCNAFKFAGETDVFEALEHARKFYPVDTNRLGLRGFSMGGAGVWHLAAHHPGVWAAAAPGAGFAETAEYTGALKKEPKPNWWEQKLWRLYDATEYAANFHNLPVIAYSGELDKQKQAADVMARAMKAAGLELQHIIGPGVAHKYEPGAKQELARRFDELMEKGRAQWPTQTAFTTPALRYASAGWVSITRMERQWEPAGIKVDWVDAKTLRITTTNVCGLKVDLSRLSPLTAPGEQETLIVDGDVLHSPREHRIAGPVLSLARPTLTMGIVADSRFVQEPPARSGWFKTPVRRSESHWTIQVAGQPSVFVADLSDKAPGVQGPIDDAFMNRFTVIRPVSRGKNANADAWLEAELARFTNEWRAQFRGDVQFISADDKEAVRFAASRSNLILWGDPDSNPVLASQLRSLPFQWDAKEIRFGTNRFDATTHVPILIFPNPLNPSRYIVLNSGPTFLDFGAASNAQQTPKLPDFAVLDITVPRKERLTRGVKLAGFFDENWQLPADAGAAR